MQIVDMGEFSGEKAAEIAEEVQKPTESLPIPEDPNAGKKKWICTACGYVHTGEELPAECPVCHQPAEKFKLM